jgi:hypothetical protein
MALIRYAESFFNNALVKLEMIDNHGGLTHGQAPEFGFGEEASFVVLLCHYSFEPCRCRAFRDNSLCTFTCLDNIVDLIHQILLCMSPLAKQFLATGCLGSGYNLLVQVMGWLVHDAGVSLPCGNRLNSPL